MRDITLPPDPDLAEVRRIVLSSLKGYSAKVYLFGSRATGQAGRASDIDVGVLADEALPGELLAEIREALEESHVPYKVDLVDLSRTDSTFRARVQASGILWNE